MAVLKSRYNVLRMFGLAGKTVIVDEVHACDPYMQGLLRQLLRWLGKLGTPVVLLSATVTTASARALISAYLEGAHGKRRAADWPNKQWCTPAGWVYAAHGWPGHRRPKIDLPARLPLRVELREIGRVSAPDGKAVPDRQPVLRAELAGLVAEGGCALVICTTVAEAQQTFARLRSWFAELAASGSLPAGAGSAALPVPGLAARGDHRPGDRPLRQEGAPRRESSSCRRAGGDRDRGAVPRPGLRPDRSATWPRWRCCCSGPAGAGATKTSR